MESSNLRRVRAIVAAGVDVDNRNEYGQTALFLACWLGCVPIARYLMDVGANVLIADNAGLTPSQLCHMLGRKELSQFLPPLVEPCSRHMAPCESAASSGSASVRVLIDPREPHPGAGSFIADGFFHDSFLSALRQLHQSLPEAPPTKPSCSRRAYYCDAARWVRTELGRALRLIAAQVQVQGQTIVSETLPHMRFLEVTH